MKQKQARTGKEFISEHHTSPGYLSINYNEIHIWRASLQLTKSEITKLKQILSADELSRAGRFHFQRDRERYIAARGILRSILSIYLKSDPSKLRFCYGLHGKPFLLGETGKYLIHFNVSHSGDHALIAVSQVHEIGVDLERIRNDISIKDVAEQFLTPREISVLNSLPEHKRHKAFFTWWTRKEACLKAAGKGLAGDAKQFEIIPVNGDPSMRLALSDDLGEAARWSIMDLDVEPEYAAALAVEGHDLHLKYMQWD